MNPSLENQPGIYAHWEKAKARGERLAAAVILGCPPCVAFTSAQKLPIDVDELHVAGGLAGAPIRVVKCITVDLLVPARSNHPMSDIARRRALPQRNLQVRAEEFAPALGQLALCQIPHAPGVAHQSMVFQYTVHTINI